MRGFAPSLARAVLPAAFALASAVGSIALAAGPAAVPSRDASSTITIVYRDRG